MFGIHDPRVLANKASRILLLAVWLAFSWLQAQGTSFTDELWTEIRPLYARTLEHRFLKGLADGSLARSRFQFYLVQDAHYLRTFAKTLSVLAAKSPRDDWSITLNRHAVNAIEAERQLHTELLASYGMSAERAANTRIAPTTYAYTNHLLRVAYEKPFREGLAAVLPCYWIYWEVGKELQKTGSQDADYQRWIDQYASEEFGHSVEQVLVMMNAEAENLDARSREVLKGLFQTSARYEWMFWDMAWQEEQWPP